MEKKELIVSWLPFIALFSGVTFINPMFWMPSVGLQYLVTGQMADVFWNHWNAIGAITIGILVAWGISKEIED